MMEPQKYTSLFGGERVRKDDLRVEACGALDELSSHLGLLAAEAPAEICDRLHEVQRRLFAIAALASGMQRATYVPGPAEEAELQAETRRLEGISGGFRGFVLPGGCPAAARADVCRTVCRRAERRLVACEIDVAVPYLNRLSGYLFALARYFNFFHHTDEINL